MKTSQFFIKTNKETSKEAKSVSHKLLVKGGYIFQTASGSFSLLPLGFRVFKKIEEIIREELNKIGCKEILMPMVHPARLWKETGRYESTGSESLKAKGRDEDYVLAMTHEEVVTDIARKIIQSYEDMPLILNQIQTKFRDEPRPRGGLLRLKEFIMQDAYSFGSDEKGLNKSYQKIKSAYENIFKKIGLDILSVSASSGMMGGSLSEEFMALSETGEDNLIICQKCDYRANLECASSLVLEPTRQIREEKIQEVETPQMESVSEVSEFLRIPATAIVKTMVYKAKDKIILALIRGDLDVNEAKLKEQTGFDLEQATKEDFKKHGLIPGFVGPIGDHKFPIYADNSIKSNKSFVVGANKVDAHIKGVTISNLDIEKWVDISLVKEGDRCPECGGQLSIKKAIELAHLFKLGTYYSEKMRALFMDKDGKRKPVLMGCYGLGLHRLMAAVVELKHDNFGIIWPSSIAPFQVYLMDISNSEMGKKVTDSLYNKLESAGIEVLYDDRNKTAGFKFAEADLIGCPLRVNISARSLKEKNVEIKLRNEKEAKMVRIDKTVERINYLISKLTKYP